MLGSRNLTENDQEEIWYIHIDCPLALAGLDLPKESRQTTAPRNAAIHQSIIWGKL